MGDGDKILNSASVRLGILGVQVTELARQRLEPLGLTPKQVGLLAFVDSKTKASQRRSLRACGWHPASWSPSWINWKL